MTIPDYQTLMRPLMAGLTDGRSQRPRDLTDRMADVFHSRTSSGPSST